MVCPLVGLLTFPPLYCCGFFFFSYFIKCPQSHHGRAQLLPDRRKSPKGMGSRLGGISPCIWGADFGAHIHSRLCFGVLWRVKRLRFLDVELEVLKLSWKNNAQFVRFLLCASFHPVQHMNSMDSVSYVSWIVLSVYTDFKCM